MQNGNGSRCIDTRKNARVREKGKAREIYNYKYINIKKTPYRDVSTTWHKNGDREREKGRQTKPTRESRR